MKGDTIISFRVWSAANNRYNAVEPEEKENGLNYYRVIGRGGCVVELGSGLKDKKGKQIFQGDILKVRIQTWRNNKKAYYYKNGIVIFGTRTNFLDEHTRFLGFWVDMKYFEKLSSFLSLAMMVEKNASVYKDVEVIGNIHENPNLTKI